MSGVMIFGILGGALLLAFLWLMGAYNALVRLRNEVRNAFSQIDVQLKRRHDLIPNLVETVKGYAGHERETFEKVIRARASAVGASGAGLADRAKAEGELSGALTRLLAVAEAYPDLKANANFKALQEELSSTENRIAFSRQFYNDSALGLNNRVEMFPTNVVAGLFHFEKVEYFKTEETERAAPKVQF